MSDHEHRGAGALVSGVPARTRDDATRAVTPGLANGFAAAWARAVRARRATAALEPREYTGAADTPDVRPADTTLASPPAPPAAVAPGAGSPWLRRR